MQKMASLLHRNGTSSIVAGLALTSAAAVAAALWVGNRTRKVERDHPPQGRFIDVDGVRLHYVERGEGEPLVLLHGNYVSGLDMILSGLVDLAAQRYRVIVFDRPGFGYSERPRGARIWGPQSQARLLRRALQQLGVDSATVLGHSWGTLVAMAMALDDPASVRSLVLVSGYYYPTPRPDAVMMLPIVTPVLGDLMRFTFSPLELRLSWPMLSRFIFAPARVTPSFKRYPPWMAARPLQLRSSAAEQSMAVPAAVRLQYRYHELSVPLILVHGSKDRMCHMDAHSERLHRELPRSQLIRVDGMGHMLHHLAPRRVMEAIDLAARAEPANTVHLPHAASRSADMSAH
jgi:pimeloyl-ACP methyl ester carboxylesterase